MPTFPNLSQNRLKEIRKLQQKKYRKLTECYICEGYRLFEEAFSAPEIMITELIIEESLQSSMMGSQLVTKAQSKNIPVFGANSAIIKQISEEVTPPGIIFIVKQHFQDIKLLKEINDDLILYLDRISEAGNIGSIMRSASWFGVKTILMSPGCVDPRNAKSVRASAGGIFNLRMFTDIQFSLLSPYFKQKNYQFVATVVSGGTPLNQWKTATKNIIFFGQEASGLSGDILKSTDTLLTIQNHGSIESLNVSMAAAIILYEHSRQTNQKNQNQ